MKSETLLNIFQISAAIFGLLAAIFGFGSLILNNKIKDSETIKRIEYPQEGIYGKNLLFPNNLEFKEGIYSMTALIPKNEKIRVVVIGKNCYYSLFQEIKGWKCSRINDRDEFLSTTNGKVELEVRLQNRDETLIEVFENDSPSPKISKKIIVQ